MVHIIKTNRLISDGRLLKWLDYLEKENLDCSVYLLADENRKDSYLKGIHRIRETRLLSRKLFKKRKGYFLKVPEYAFKYVLYLFKSKEKIFIFHDGQQYLNIFLTLLGNNFFWKKKIIWDLHELPHTIFLKTKVTRWFLSYILNSVDMIVYTNSERREYILSNYNYDEKNFVVLNNYPDKNFLEAAKARLPEDLNAWLKKEDLPYVLWMGEASKGRNFESVLNTFKKFKSRVKLVIMGNVPAEFKEEVNELIQEGCVFNKFVSQKEIISYVDNALFSVVLYNSSTPNNYLCEPNRLYQLLGRKIPVIGGSNPVIKRNIENINGGIVLTQDGSCSDELEEAFRRMFQVNEKLRQNMEDNEWLLLEMTWDKQFEDVKNKLDLLIKRG